MLIEEPDRRPRPADSYGAIPGGGRSARHGHHASAVRTIADAERGARGRGGGSAAVAHAVLSSSSTPRMDRVRFTTGAVLGATLLALLVVGGKGVRDAYARPVQSAATAGATTAERESAISTVATAAAVGGGGAAAAAEGFSTQTDGGAAGDSETGSWSDAGADSRQQGETSLSDDDDPRVGSAGHSSSTVESTDDRFASSNSTNGTTSGSEPPIATDAPSDDDDDSAGATDLDDTSSTKMLGDDDDDDDDDAGSSIATAAEDTAPSDDDDDAADDDDAGGSIATAAEDGTSSGDDDASVSGSSSSAEGSSGDSGSDAAADDDAGGSIATAAENGAPSGDDDAGASGSSSSAEGSSGDSGSGSGPTDDAAQGSSGGSGSADDSTASGWEVYKYALPIKSGSGEETFKLVTDYLCPAMSAPVDLGCGGTKVGCTLKCADCDSIQLHWVDSQVLDDHSGPLRVDGWQEYFQTLNGNMTRFNAFMHNKNQLYVSDLGQFQRTLDGGGVPYMKRLSAYPMYGYMMAHIGVDVAGRVVELVGPAVTLDDDAGFTAWADSECPAAHALPYAMQSYDEWASATSFDDDDEISGWQSDDRPVPMFAGTSVASHDPTLHSTLFTQLYNFTGVSATVLQSDEYCDVVALKWESFAGYQLTYVHNKQAHVGEYDLEDYDTYIEAVHQQYSSAKANGDWFGWDHFMDQHIGLKYQEIGDACDAEQARVRKQLRTSDVPVGERRDYEGLTTGGLSGNTTHFYTGYKGSLAWELNVQCSSDEGAPNVCTCVPENNDRDYKLTSGTNCKAEEGIGDPAAVGPTFRRL